ncbi:hypothetical protein [Kribbia dieselivorans]|uniref:hypothetical protein n=1 Tax=Kribbia dieselivorans TaxID=331526 RepID=UPI000838317C|nr:hypothetical protein [Kribbia dieselivorans]
MSMTLSRVLLESESHVVKDLPIPPWAFGALTLVLFLVLLAVTYAFRYAGARYTSQVREHEH